MNIPLRDVTSKMPSGLITVDRAGKITGHNPASDRIFGETLIIGFPLHELVRESSVLDTLLGRCMTTGEVFSRVEFNVPAATGDKRIGINLSPITVPNGEIEGAICLLSDLTEIVELESRIKLKENFAALGEMSAGIAHEFKNSIATIVGYAQMSTSETELKSIQSYAREILKESRALSSIVTDFLNFARPVKASIHETDLVELLRSVIGDLRNLRQGQYDVKFLSSGEAIVDCDPTLMRQSFLNLLINATEALNGAGTITVVVDAPPDRSHIRVLVEDTGHGVPQDALGKIFFPFFTTKPQGTGLGLSLVQKIMLAHNGRIEVQSTEGKGTRFTVTLPKK
jgi:PAS domain S-box-containing protein